MSQLPESYEKDYLELLKPYVSEEQKKSRRNVLVSSFTVTSVFTLGKSLTDLSLFGINLNGSSNYSVLIIAEALILYWLAMYFAYSFRDEEIQKEQKHLLLNHVGKVKERMNALAANMEASITNTSLHSHWLGEYNSVKGNYDIYENQLSRTSKVGNLNNVLKRVEYWLPVIAGLAAILIINCDIAQYLIKG